MFSLIKSLFGTPTDYNALMKLGARIIDVRTKGEYAGGHIKDSVNIPLDALPAQLEKLAKDVPIITCCASGMRSSAAKSILKSHGFKDVYNGGGWMSLQGKL